MLKTILSALIATTLTAAVVTTTIVASATPADACNKKCGIKK